MILRNSVPKPTKKRKNYSGAERVVGTKDYALILTNLRGLINQLPSPRNDRDLIEILKKVSIKLKELGYKQVSEAIKKKAGKLEKVKKELPNIIQNLNEIWKEGKIKQEEVKKSDKQKELDKTTTTSQASNIIDEDISDELL
jgi:hypothetical protein